MGSHYLRDGAAPGHRGHGTGFPPDSRRIDPASLEGEHAEHLRGETKRAGMKRRVDEREHPQITAGLRRPDPGRFLMSRARGQGHEAVHGRAE